jgi:hypothetical protein
MELRVSREPDPPKPEVPPSNPELPPMPMPERTLPRGPDLPPIAPPGPPGMTPPVEECSVREKRFWITNRSAAGIFDVVSHRSWRESDITGMEIKRASASTREKKPPPRMPR